MHNGPEGGEIILDYIVYIIETAVLIFLSALEIAFLLRAILSWFMTEEDSKIALFLVAVTEPVIIPVRLLFEKFGWGEGIPIDLPFIVTYLIISLLEMLLTF